MIPPVINEALSGDRSNIEQYFDNIKISIEKNEALYKELFVEDYFNFSCLINNIFTDKSDYNFNQQIMALNFIKIYNKNIRGKYFGVFSDTGFVENILSISDNLSGRTEVIEVRYELWFNEYDKKGEVFSVNNMYFKYLLKYRRFIEKINGNETTNINYRNTDAFFIVNENRG
jgi:hypothetical protein